MWAVSAVALEWQQVGNVRMAKLPVPVGGKTGFTLVPSGVTGILFTNSLPVERAMTNLNLLNGSGVALGDYDGDGLCDIYLCDLGGNNKLYKNLGNWKFKDVTDEAGVACPNQTSTGAVFADVNGDGRLDLLVTSMGGPNALFLNEGNGHFTNVTVSAGLESKLGSTSMALADIDGNGTLDLYVANYGVNSIIRTGGALSFAYVNGKPTVRGRYAQRIKFVGDMMFELGEPHVLYLNDGKGRFTPLSWTDGNTFVDENGKPLTEIPRDQGLSVAFRDLNGDGYPDIYVCNDAFTPDRCWINDGHGHFRALPHLAWRSTSFFSMNCDFADLDRDGNDDFLVVDMLSRQHRLALTQMSNMPPQPSLPGDLDTQFQMRRNTLFLNRGDGTYAEIANYAGLAASEWNWSCIFLDVDLDGWEDLLISNGFFYNVDDVDTKERIKKMGTLPLDVSRRTISLFPRLDTPNLVFRNQHDLTFKETAQAWGFDSKAISNGTALGDLDNDGDLDVVVNCLNGQALLYRNETSAPRIAVRLKGKSPNTRGIGAKIKVYGGPVTQSQEMMCGGRYVSGDDPMRVFAAGNSTNLTVEVTWRSGARSRILDCQPNYVYEIDEAGAMLAQLKDPGQQPAKPSLFRDVSELVRHQHHQEQFDDFARQPLLPRRLSQAGPGVAWFDVDGDGLLDIYFVNQLGGNQLWRNLGHGKFENITAQAGVGLDDRVCSGASFADIDNDGLPDLFVTTVKMGNVLFKNLGHGKFKDITKESGVGYVGHSSGAVFFDFNNDGLLDLFVANVGVYTKNEKGRGGFYLAYPDAFTGHLFPERSEQSILYLNLGGGKFKDVSQEMHLQHRGWSGDASFYDLNQDGYLAQSSMPLYFGLGEASKADRIDVLWPSGRKQTITEQIPVNGLMVITESR